VIPALLATLAVVYAMSWGLYRVVEVPAKRWLRLALTPRRLAAAPTGGN
jgi:peptidoglycan/LPS O-acetylase OafA/YrhL